MTRREGKAGRVGSRDGKSAPSSRKIIEPPLNLAALDGFMCKEPVGSSLIRSGMVGSCTSLISRWMHGKYFSYYPVRDQINGFIRNGYTHGLFVTEFTVYLEIF
jgi:hypothetical protein